MLGIERRSPYQGLLPYEADDAPFFFGREKETRLIIANLFASPLTLLYGGSGVGKSSVLGAGVLHQLRPRDELLVVVFKGWQADPVADLKVAVAEAAASATREILPAPGSEPLSEYLAGCAEQVKRRLMIILDQFEEYFLYHLAEDEFSEEFPEALSHDHLAASFLISIREDALARLDRFEGRIRNLFDNILRIEHLDREAARAAIGKPVDQYNRVRASSKPQITIEPALVETVLQQVQTGKVVMGEAGRGMAVGRTDPIRAKVQIETPFLQLVMTRLWDEEMRTGSNSLRLETLERLGGAERIVRTHLDGVMSTLPESGQEAAARVFHYLVTPGGTKIAHTVTDLAEYSGLQEAQLIPILTELSGGDLRILRPVAPPPDQPSVQRFEIFHDVLGPAILDWRTRYLQAWERRRADVEVVLERLQGMALTLSRLFAAGSFTLAIPLVAAMMERPESPGLILPVWLVAAGTAGSLGLFMVAGGALLYLWRRINRALGLGLSWLSVAEVLSVRPGEVSRLLAGTSESRRLNASTRNRIRNLRLTGAAAVLAFGVLPVPGLYAVVALGSKGLLELSLAPVVVFGPSAFMLLVGLLVGVWERIAVHRARRIGRQQDVPSSIARHMIMPSHEGLDLGPVGRGPGWANAARRYAGWLVVTLMALLVVGSGLILSPVGFVNVSGLIFWQIAMPDVERLSGRVRVAEVGRGYQLPRDELISPLVAGGALYTLSEVGQSGRERKPFERPVPRQIAEEWYSPGKGNPFGTDSDKIFETLILRAVRGFGTDETGYLERIASHPGFTEYGIVARAPALDRLGAQFEAAFPDSMTIWELPTLSLISLIRGSRAHIAKAALDLFHGRRGEAETTLRLTVSFGLRLMDNGVTAIETVVGAGIVQIGLKSLEDFYTVTGRNGEARRIREAMESATRTPDESGLTQAQKRSEYPGDIWLSGDIAVLRGRLVSHVQDTRLPRGLRWEMLVFLMTSPCTNVREMVFGPTKDLQAIIDDARDQLVRFPSERELFELARTWPDRVVARPPRGLVPTVVRAGGWLLGNNRLSSCLDLLQLSSML